MKKRKAERLSEHLRHRRKQREINRQIIFEQQRLKSFDENFLLSFPIEIATMFADILMEREDRDNMNYNCRPLAFRYLLHLRLACRNYNSYYGRIENLLRRKFPWSDREWIQERAITKMSIIFPRGVPQSLKGFIPSNYSFLDLEGLFITIAGLLFFMWNDYPDKIPLYFPDKIVNWYMNKEDDDESRLDMNRELIWHDLVTKGFVWQLIEELDEKIKETARIMNKRESN